MKTLSLKIPETLEGDLVAYAAERGVSKSEVVREALKKLFGRERPAHRKSALVLVEDLVGALEGPEDLASNPAHLEGFGRERP